MGSQFFTFNKIPDLTLAQYSVQEGGGIDDIIKQHGIFYRQLCRKGILFDEIYHLIYVYVPGRPPGSRLQVLFRADSKDTPVCMQEFMTATSLSAFFKFRQTQLSDQMEQVTFPYRASLAKSDAFVPSSIPNKSMRFYTVDPWKPNEKARLMGLFRMMQRLGHPAAFVVTMQGVEQSEVLRASFGMQIQYIRNALKQEQGVRDDNAEQSLRVYERFFEKLREEPHFFCRISTFAQQEPIAKMLLDAAASEAVEEGTYRVICEKGVFSPLRPDNPIEKLCLGDAPHGMRTWNTLFFLKELVPFAMLPVLYSGETIEIQKDSAPVYQNTGLLLGQDPNGYDVYMPLDLLTKHALLTGVPGAGKTHSMLHIASHLAAAPNDIPILVLEPAKKEYRALAHNRRLPDLLVFSPGAPGSFPLRIDPFEFPEGIKLSEHITNLIEVFEGAFDLEPPMPFLLSKGIETVYRDKGWYPFEINDGSHPYPTIRELFDKVAVLLDQSDYAPEIKGNLKSVLQVRLGTLITREMGDVFDVERSTLSPTEWLRSSCVIELESLGSYAANFLTLLLLTLIREVLRQDPCAPKDKPRHAIFLEEAHNLIGPTTVANAANGNTKVASTKYIVDMLAEVRALQEAIIIADQLPTALAPQVSKNTSLKIAHRMTAQDDRELLAATMSADGVQFERMASFIPGQALCIYEKVMKPFEVRIQKYDDVSEPPNNELLFELLRDRPVYREAMRRDAAIMLQKFSDGRKRINDAVRLLFETKEIVLENERIVSTSSALTVEMAAKVKVQLQQYQRDLRKLILRSQEHILEINVYAKMNIPFADVLIDYLFGEFNEAGTIFLDLMAQFQGMEVQRETDAVIDAYLARVDKALAWIQDSAQA